jgi:5-methylcytosine-specific restriction protein A
VFDRLLALFAPAAAGARPGAARSSHWPAVRAAHLKANPACAACGARAPLEVHHVKPFHLYPVLELDPANLITLCESPSHNCHLMFGHLLLWASWNVQVRVSAANFLMMVQSRPLVRE